MDPPRISHLWCEKFILHLLLQFCHLLRFLLKTLSGSIILYLKSFIAVAILTVAVTFIHYMYKYVFFQLGQVMNNSHVFSKTRQALYKEQKKTTSVLLQSF